MCVRLCVSLSVRVCACVGYISSSKGLFYYLNRLSMHAYMIFLFFPQLSLRGATTQPTNRPIYRHKDRDEWADEVIAEWPSSCSWKGQIWQRGRGYPGTDG